MGVTFNGSSKLIICTPGTTTISVVDLYSRWKDWLLIGTNTKFLPAFSALGGDTLPGGKFLGTTVFLENGWKIRPYEGNHTLTVSGNLYSRDGSSPFVNTLGSYNVLINLSTSNLVDTVSTGGSTAPTAIEVADAVFDRTDAIETGLTMRQALRLALATLAGKVSGSGTNNISIKNAVADNKTRIQATTDNNGNRTAITYDVT